MAVTWNVVNNTGDAYDLVADKLRPKVCKLEDLFAPPHEETVHLHVVLDENSHKKFYRVALHLETPHRGFHARKRSKSLVASLDTAFNALFRQITEWRSKSVDLHHHRNNGRNGARDAFALGRKEVFA